MERQLRGIADAGEFLVAASGSIVSPLRISERMRAGATEDRLWAVADAILSPNMQARRAIEGGRCVLHFGNLYSYAHSQLAEWLEKGQFGRCDTCLSFFPRTDKRQRYCPPALREQTESQCGARARMRKRRGSTERFTVPDDGQSLFLLTQDNEVPPEFAAQTDSAPA